jgi:thiosulfate/3-mercaptopyruvate sulfurtransferase
MHQNDHMHDTLISASELNSLLRTGPAPWVMDCSFDLNDPLAGQKQFEEAHIPGAMHAHLDRHLSDKYHPAGAQAGRHPLPSPAHFENWLQSTGLAHGQQVVVYDRQGANYCGRLWWMLKWSGHAAVAVLDGGLQAWQAEGFPVESGPGALANTPASEPFRRQAPLVASVSTADIASRLGAPDLTIIDARAAPRFRGDVEPLDPVAGHIPGALNRPFPLNLDANGRFKASTQLRQEFEALLAGREPSSVVHHCGSGVSAVPNLLAMAIAGMGLTALYPGSWSAWCNTPETPIARSQ